MMSMEEKKCKLWWSRKGDGVGVVRVMVKEELCENVAEVRRVSDCSCVCFLRECAEAGLCSAKWNKFGRKTVFL